MQDEDVIEKLWKIVGRLYDRPRDTSILGQSYPPFDISKPNLHDSKTEFQAELSVVDAALAHLSGLEKVLRGAYEEDDPDHAAAFACVKAVDDATRRNRPRGAVEYPIQLVVDNAVQLGASLTSLFLVLELREGFSKRKQELEAQREEFWEVSGRPPNYYARTIALRLAKEVALYTGKKPTFGTARDGGHASTEFGRALEDIFRLLGISAQVKNPAVWAIEELTEEDLKRKPVNALADLYYARPTKPHGLLNALADFAEGTSKGGGA